MVVTSVAQNNLKDKSLYNDTYIPDAVIDEKYGITMFEPLNMMLGSDTVRNDRNGYAANGYQEDYYSTGQLLHKGFYVDGQLKVYKNYFPNGEVERNFRMVDLKKSKMTNRTQKYTVLIYDVNNQQITPDGLRTDFQNNDVAWSFMKEYRILFPFYTFALLSEDSHHKTLIRFL